MGMKFLWESHRCYLHMLSDFFCLWMYRCTVSIERGIGTSERKGAPYVPTNWPGRSCNARRPHAHASLLSSSYRRRTQSRVRVTGLPVRVFVRACDRSTAEDALPSLSSCLYFSCTRMQRSTRIETYNTECGLCLRLRDFGVRRGQETRSAIILLYGSSTAVTASICDFKCLVPSTQR